VPAIVEIALVIMNALGAATLHPAQAAAPSTPVDAEVDKLEVRFFEHDYPLDTVDARLTRLEDLVFGEARTGSDQQRVAMILQALPPPEPAASSGQTARASGGPPAGAGSASGSGSEPRVSSNDDDDRNYGADSGDYPRVTALENEILGKSYADEPVSRRLGQLETRVFGKPSEDLALSDRCDRLEQYAVQHLHMRPFPQQTGADDVAYADGGGYMPSRPAPEMQVVRKRPVDAGPPPAGASMLEKVGWMEDRVFARTYDDEHLLARLRRLETVLFPNDHKHSSDMQLMDQVDTLMAAAELQHPAAPTTGAAPNSTLASGDVPQPAPGQGTARAPAYAGEDKVGDPTVKHNDPAQPGQSPFQRHPMMRSLAEVLGTAGNMALGATGNSVFFNGPYGPGYWY